MHAVVLKNLVIGEGIPKICAPIVGKNLEEIKEQAEQIAAAGGDVDIAEWRVDFFEDLLKKEKLEEGFRVVRKALGHMPFIFTFRSSAEGGNFELSPKAYEELIIEAARLEADLIDIELLMEDVDVPLLVKNVHDYESKVILSNHDFHKTPQEELILERLQMMQLAGGDICKIAVMPQSKEDVLVLLRATEKMRSTYAKVPLVTMSMAEDGKISRIAGGWFGSDLTFAAVGNTSAPGQISASRMRKLLNLIYDVREEQ